MWMHSFVPRSDLLLGPPNPLCRLWGYFFPSAERIKMHQIYKPRSAIDISFIKIFYSISFWSSMVIYLSWWTSDWARDPTERSASTDPPYSLSSGLFGRQ